MYCPSSVSSCVLFIRGPVLLLWIFGKASSVSFKDSSEEGEVPQSQHKEVAQWWGEWSSWSTCSRTCGGGVQSQERHCLQQRLVATYNGNTSVCSGSAKKYRLCQNQLCPNNGVSFKQLQCSLFNAKAFGRRYYTWVPLYPDDYISISNRPCDLQCTTTTGEKQLLVPAQDGTYCRDWVYQGVCIEGRCQVVGCDGKLYSGKTVDKCGVCGGSGASCYRVSGSYRKGIAQLGYLLITNIPAGATDIQVIERRKTENILALSDEAGHFFFNGNSVIDNPRNFHVAGTIFKYRRPAGLFADGFEYIIAQGPTNQGLNIMYYNLNGKMPHITYEYTVPWTPSPRTTATMMLAPEPVQLVPLEAVPDPGRDTNDTLVELAYNNEIDVSEQYKLQNSTSAIVQYKGVVGDPGTDVLEWRFQTPPNFTSVPSDVLFQNNVGNSQEGHKGTVDTGSDSNTINRNGADLNGTHRTSKLLFRGQLFKLGIPSKPGALRRMCKNSSALCPNLEGPQNTLEVLPGSLTPDPHSDSKAKAAYRPVKQLRPLANDTFPQQVGVLNHQVEPAQAPGTESNEFEVGPPDRDISLADMYRWKVSAYAPCSSTCTTGISTSYALCVRYDGQEVDDSYCDSMTRPEPTHEFCTGKECPPRWETSQWSECSRTCGEGHQYRLVRCWRMMAPGFDSSVYDDLCRAAELPKPMGRKVCRNRACGPQWEVSAWSECSARCGRRGVQIREVRCSMEARLCNDSAHPEAERECEGPPCDRRWTVSDWGPCSGPCGEGRMTRSVVCKNSSGNVISDVACDLDLKPLVVYPCGEQNCPAHWVEQEWEQCNATCGRGVKTRQVVCSGLENGVFKEFPKHACSAQNKPLVSSACFERPCSKWFTTTWSQCSKTCGSGVKVREVKCYQGEELGHSCDMALKPEARQACEVQACPTEAPVEEECQDKATANCALVLKVKLCTHWYYRKACCLSCKSKTQ
ncbi:ADAMTS-like protein 2 isoform X1 [Brienomyrus brachyistius]|uniref:ADAMTS-like protein 2 isoform X1 n=1 Tax=Brienomyrus brachyistius TaxID=42636 RepID=UPI0020B20D41|nr:ADAMTS-like protein 2 isoform X1 [Brienomyrus brachyistius]